MKPTQNNAVFPSLLKDISFKEAFIEDMTTVTAQFSKALNHRQPEDTADKHCMNEVMSAMHMLRGAAGSIDFSLAFNFAEAMHRIAEVGLSFSDNLRDDFLKIFFFLKEAEILLNDIIISVQTENIGKSAKDFTKIEAKIAAQYGDYFYKKEESDESQNANLVTPDTTEHEDLEAFISTVQNASAEPSEEVKQEESSNTDSEYSLKSDAPADWDVLQYFYQEIDESLTGLEQAWMQLEKGLYVDSSIKEVLRITHSTKGAANSMGMFRIARMMHEIESVFERLLAGKIEFYSNDYTVLLNCADSIRCILTETKDAKEDPALEQHIGEIFQALQQLQSRQESERPKEIVEISKVVEPIQAQPIELVDETSSSTTKESGTFRIDAGKVDALMNTVGELIISRTRMSKKISELLGLCGELSKSRNQMKDTVQAFAESFEYTNEKHRTSVNNSTPSTDFTSLEFDRYDEFNILSRQITEIGNDTEIAIQQILSSGQEVERESDILNDSVSKIQDEIANTRLAPISILFKRLQRSVRDAAVKSGCNVAFETIGNDLLIDKSIMDDLFPPMLHLVRNSVAHGFSESAADNTITIEAKQTGARILIEVHDNGRGIDYDQIRQHAISQGLIDESQKSPERLQELIFEPGFSTAETVDELSGRGIGLDVVKDFLTTMGGAIDLKSEINKGTTFSLQLPLTLAIERGMYFNVGSQLYAVFMSTILRVYFTRDVQFEQVGSKEVALIDEETVQVLDLRDLFGVQDVVKNPREATILCHYLDRKIALKVDRIFYQDDIVVKSLGKLFDGHQSFGAATIYGDGEIVPILDISRITSEINSPEAPVRKMPEREKGKDQKKILVVDDSLSVRKVAEVALKESGFYVDTANDGIQAMSKVKEMTYDLILTDLEMPRLNGLELIAELKRREASVNIPIVVITSRTTDKHKEKALSLGASKCLGKPFTLESILEAIKAYV